MELTIIQKIAAWALPVLFAITLHEVAHGWVASLRGDQTARLMGRLTLNPLKHIDLIGTIILPLFLLIVSNFIFGWAKPVPVDARNLKNPRIDMVWVAAAGPVSNLLMALGWTLMLKLGISMDSMALMYMGSAGMIINVILAVLNLIPIPPLDGGRIVANCLPARSAYFFSRLEPYGFIILVILLMTGMLTKVMSPLINWVMTGIVYAFGLRVQDIIF